MPKDMTKDEFELAFRRYMDDGGHGYDTWDIAVSWAAYQQDPEGHWLTKEARP